MNRIYFNAYTAPFINHAALSLSGRQKIIFAVAAGALALLAAAWFVATRCFVRPMEVVQQDEPNPLPELFKQDPESSKSTDVGSDQLQEVEHGSHSEAPPAEQPGEEPLEEQQVLDLEEATPDVIPAVDVPEIIPAVEEDEVRLAAAAAVLDLDTDAGKTEFEELAQKAHTLKLSALRTALSRRVAQWDRNEKIENDASFLFHYCLFEELCLFFSQHLKLDIARYFAPFLAEIDRERAKNLLHNAIEHRLHTKLWGAHYDTCDQLFALASMDSEEAAKGLKELPAAAWMEFRLGGVGLFVLLTKMAKINAQIDLEEACKTLIQALDLVDQQSNLYTQGNSLVSIILCLKHFDHDFARQMVPKVIKKGHALVAADSNVLSDLLNESAKILFLMDKDEAHELWKQAIATANLEDRGKEKLEALAKIALTLEPIDRQEAVAVLQPHFDSAAPLVKWGALIYAHQILLPIDKMRAVELFEQALQVVPQFEKESEKLLALREMACGIYYYRGFIEGVPIDNDRTKALLPEIMKLLAQEKKVDQFNHLVRLASTFAMIDGPIARDLIRQALEIMESLKPGDMKSSFLIDIFHAFARFDQQAAEEILKQIDDPYLKLTAQLELATSPRDLLDIFKEALLLEQDNSTAELLSKIAAKLEM